MTYWTDPKKTEALVKFHDAGLSAAQIAAALFHEFREEVSRNAVIGKITRLGRGTGRKRSMEKKRRVANGNGCETNVHLPSLRKRRQRALEAAAPPDEPAWTPPVPPDCDPVAFAEIAPGQCRFPVSGSGAGMLCCGGEVVDRFVPEGRRELTHCAFHFARMHGDGTASPRPPKRQRMLLGVGY